jgi:hypothetical protein
MNEENLKTEINESKKCYQASPTLRASKIMSSQITKNNKSISLKK